MKNILITGFNPFGGENVNPSYEAVKLLEDSIKGVNIIKKEIPTEFFGAKKELISLIKEYKPDFVINVGQAGGRESISIEKQAFNLMDASIPDNAGFKPSNQKISDNGKDVLYSSLPIEQMKENLINYGIPCYISNSAGRYVCNYVMYCMLEEAEKYNFKSGFVHVPYSREQVKNKKDGTPFMEISKMAESLKSFIDTIIDLC